MGFIRLLVLPLAVLLAGCVPSLNALYGPGDLVREAALEGAFVGPEGEVLVFTPADADSAYRLAILNADDEAAVLKAGLTRIDGQLYLDMVPLLPGAFSDSAAMAVHLEVYHSFYRVDLTDEGLEILEPDIVWLNRRLEAEPTALAHYVGDGLHLIAETAALRAFVAAEPGLFSGEARRYRRLY